MFPSLNMLPGPMSPDTYFPLYLCAPVSVFPRPMFPSIYVPQYLCSPVSMFPEFHNKRQRDTKSVIGAMFNIQCFHHDNLLFSKVRGAAHKMNLAVTMIAW